MPVDRLKPPRGGTAFAALLLASLVAASPALAAGVPISIVVDRAKVMHISRPASTVIIGNPAIADATIQDNQTLIITGRSYGTTNLIVLDNAGKPIADEVLTVEASNDDIVTVYKRADRETFSCTPDCAPTLAIGDAANFDTIKDQIKAHGDLSSDAAAK